MSSRADATTIAAPLAGAGPGTLGATLWLAVAEQVRRFRRYRRRVLAAKDPEDLHQLRVALRRLRAAVTVGREAVDFPPNGDPETLFRLGKALGRLRDVDIALEVLDPLVVVAKGDEATDLGTIMAELRRLRQATRRAIRRALASRQVERTCNALRKWVQAPRFCPFAFRPLAAAAAGLLAPAEAAVRDHPGWSVGARNRPWSRAEDATLHDLRKRAKSLRYGVEILSRPHPDMAAQLLDTLRRLQDCLGAVHDVEAARLLVKWAGSRIGVEPPALILGHLTRLGEAAAARWNELQPAGYSGMVRTAVGDE